MACFACFHYLPQVTTCLCLWRKKISPSQTLWVHWPKKTSSAWFYQMERSTGTVRALGGCQMDRVDRNSKMLSLAFITGEVRVGWWLKMMVWTCMYHGQGRQNPPTKNRGRGGNRELLSVNIWIPGGRGCLKETPSSSRILLWNFQGRKPFYQLPFTLPNSAHYV